MLCDFNFLARTVVITARTVINAAHNTKNRRPTDTVQVKYIAKHYPFALHHILGSLVKGEVLSPEKIRATTGGIAPYPHQPSQTRTIPCPAPRPCLPSKKGRWHGCRGFSACCTVFRWSCFYDSETFPSRDGGDCSLSAPSMRFSALSLENHQHPYLARSSRCT